MTPHLEENYLLMTPIMSHFGAQDMAENYTQC